MNVAWIPDVATRNQQSRKAVLAESRLFVSGCLSAEEKAALESAIISSRKLDAGRDLVRQRDRVNSLHLVTEGWACRYTITQDGGRHLPAILIPGDIANPDSLLFARLGYGVRAPTVVNFVELSRDRVLELADQHRGIARAFIWLAMTENAALTEAALSLSRRSARERLAHMLCELGVRLGANKDKPCFAFPLTQDQIADGLVEIKNRVVNILDAAALRHVAGFQPGYLRLEHNVHDGATNVGRAMQHAVNFANREHL